MLTLFVGLNLSLICQGHIVGGHQIHPHFTLFAANAHAEVSPGAHAEAESAGNSDATDISEAAVRGANMLSVGYVPGAPLEAAALSILGLALLLLVIRGLTLQTLSAPSLRSLKPQFTVRPEPPPPRAISLLIATL